MKAIKITTNNKISVIYIHEPTLKGMQEQVGGYIETVRPVGLYELNITDKYKLIMIANEDGHRKGLNLNRVATQLYNLGYVDMDPIVGDVLFMSEGFINGEPDIVGLEDDQIIALYQELKSRYSFLKEKKCRVCGCTDVCACPGGCYWVQDDLCSSCWKEFIDEELEFEERLEEERTNEME